MACKELSLSFWRHNVLHQQLRQQGDEKWKDVCKSHATSPLQLLRAIQMEANSSSAASKQAPVQLVVHRRTVYAEIPFCPEPDPPIRDMSGDTTTTKLAALQCSPARDPGKQYLVADGLAIACGEHHKHSLYPHILGAQPQFFCSVLSCPSSSPPCSLQHLPISSLPGGKIIW